MGRLKNSCQELFSELRNITTIDLAYNAITIFEKALWGLIGVLGSMWAVYFISMQLRQEHASILLPGDIKSTELKYPAITICPKIATKYAIAERLGNFIDPMKVPEELLSLRQDFFLRSLQFKERALRKWITLSNPKANYYKDYYMIHCMKSKPEDGCKVRICLPKYVPITNYSTKIFRQFFSCFRMLNPYIFMPNQRERI